MGVKNQFLTNFGLSQFLMMANTISRKFSAKKNFFGPIKKSALFFKRSTSEIGPKISLLIFSFRKIIFTDSCS